MYIFFCQCNVIFTLLDTLQNKS
uniref:Uncharacterized protein n=1 Tax=Anguilla anguilla TaxID=7936 RepID=A0A0E9TGN5_ANGAN